MGFNRLILIFHHIYGKGNMLHTQVSKVMQVKKQKNKKICFSLVSALALLPYTSTTQVKKTAKIHKYRYRL